MYRRELVLPSENVLLAEKVVENDFEMSLQNLYFGDLNQFVAGNVQDYLNELELDVEARMCLKEGVNVKHCFRKFKGNFKGKKHECPSP